MAPADSPEAGSKSSPEAVLPSFVDKGKRLIIRHQFLDAVKSCRIGLLAHPSSVEGRLILSMGLMALGRFDEVLSEMRVAEEVAPHSVMVHLVRAEALMHLGLYAKARGVLRQAAEIAPNDRRVDDLLSQVPGEVLNGETSSPRPQLQTLVYPASAARALEPTAERLDELLDMEALRTTVRRSIGRAGQEHAEHVTGASDGPPAGDAPQSSTPVRPPAIDLDEEPTRVDPDNALTVFARKEAEELARQTAESIEQEVQSPVGTIEPSLRRADEATGAVQIDQEPNQERKEFKWLDISSDDLEEQGKEQSASADAKAESGDPEQHRPDVATDLSRLAGKDWLQDAIRSEEHAGIPDELADDTIRHDDEPTVPAPTELSSLLRQASQEGIGHAETLDSLDAPVGESEANYGDAEDVEDGHGGVEAHEAGEDEAGEGEGGVGEAGVGDVERNSAIRRLSYQTTGAGDAALARPPRTLLGWTDERKCNREETGEVDVTAEAPPLANVSDSSVAEIMPRRGDQSASAAFSEEPARRRPIEGTDEFEVEDEAPGRWPATPDPATPNASLVSKVADLPRKVGTSELTLSAVEILPDEIPPLPEEGLSAQGVEPPQDSGMVASESEPQWPEPGEGESTRIHSGRRRVRAPDSQSSIEPSGMPALPADDDVRRDSLDGDSHLDGHGYSGAAWSSAEDSVPPRPSGTEHLSAGGDFDYEAFAPHDEPAISGPQAPVYGEPGVSGGFDDEYDVEPRRSDYGDSGGSDYGNSGASGYSNSGGSDDDRVLRSGTAHLSEGSFEPSVMSRASEDSAYSDDSGNPSSSIEQSRSRPRWSLLRRKGGVSRQPSFFARFVAKRGGHHWIVLTALGAGGVVLALGIGFLVRSYRGTNFFERSRKAIMQSLRRGNLNDYRAAAQTLARMAAKMPNNRQVRLMHARIRAAIPIEFGEGRTPSYLRTMAADGAESEEQAALAIYVRLAQGKLVEASSVAFSARNLYPRSALLQYLQGKIELLKGNLVSAREYFRRSVQLQRSSAVFQAALGQVMAKQGDCDDALDVYAQALRYSPTHVGALLGRARCLIHMGDRAEAADAIRTVLKTTGEAAPSRGQRARAFLLLARLNLRKGEISQAQANIARAEEGAPSQDAAFYDELAALLIDTFQLGRAEDVANRAAAIIPGRPQPLILRTTVYLMQSRVMDAQAALRGFPSDSEGHWIKARVDLAMGQVRNARREISGTGDSDQLMARIVESEVLRAEGRLDRAVSLLRRLAIDHPHGVAIPLALGQTLLEQGQSVEARTAFKQALQADGSCIKARIGLTQVLLAEGRFDEAHRRLIRLTREHPWCSACTVRLAELNLGRWDLAAAQTNLEAVLGRDSNDQGARIVLAHVLTAERDFAEAEQQLAQVSGAAPGRRRLEEGRLSLARGEMKRTVESLKAASRVMSEDPAPRELLASAYLFDNRLEQAEAVVEDLAQKFPQNPVAYVMRGRLELDRGRSSPAQRAFRRALRMMRRRVRFPADEAELLTLVGQAYFEQSKSLEALKEYRAAAKICQFCPGPLYRQGLALDELGRRGKAIAALQHAARLSPRMLDIYYDLAKIYEADGQREQAIKMYSHYLTLDPPELLAREVRRAIALLQR